MATKKAAAKPVAKEATKQPAKAAPKAAVKTKIFDTPDKKVKAKKAGISNNQIMRMMGETLTSKASE